LVVTITSSNPVLKPRGRKKPGQGTSKSRLKGYWKRRGKWADKKAGGTVPINVKEIGDFHREAGDGTKSGEKGGEKVG